MAAYLAVLQADYPVLLYAIVLCFGLIVGSFLNVVIYRIPVMLEREWNAQASEILHQAPAEYEPFNLAIPNSHCPACNHAIKPWENIPLLSYALLRGRCSACKVPISPRYPMVELATGLITVVVIYHFGLSLSGAAALVLTFSLIAAAMIDYDHRLIPDDITLPLLWLGLIANYYELFVPFADAFWGAVAGYMILWTVYQVFRLVTGKEGMGYGDFKLLGMLGAWMGWQVLPLTIILSSFAGAIIGGSLIALGRDRTNPIPFGPYLALAGFIAFLWGNDITKAYLHFAAN